MTTQSEIESSAVDSPRGWARGHSAQYLATDGSEVDHPRAESMVLLYTTGRKTGKIRRTSLVSFVDDEGNLLVVASMGGAPTNPSWYLNLIADPTVWLRVKDDFYEARAEVLTSQERAPIWEMITRENSGFADYQAKTERVIPVVRLRRV
jgi:deazaflavin-dependent oxidoreductase (nitroreductase family)